ncbi:MAG TPA: hypothetical protein VMZ29_03285 [Candidatus Bathyarchaeia archaeon]|nr:hypothetical protein [Candidatus Bathyarchaeia archaeon]
MERKWNKVVIVFLAIVLISSTVILVNYNQQNRTRYLLDKQIPGIVKGTAKMVDTEAYFTKYTLQQSSIKLDLVCNNSANLRISLGYKSSTEPLAEANYPLKEKLIWSNSLNTIRSSANEVSGRIIIDSDLDAFGFTTDEYIKADERIFYLRINDISGGPYGYETTITTEINGSLFELPEFIPHIHYINEFKLVFDELIFETLLYPFFDGSNEIIIPIRGVNHELVFEDSKIENEILGVKHTSYSTTTPTIGASNMWTIVFGTGNYLWQSASDDLLYPPMECRSFILGCARTILPEEFEPGIMDYGWRVAYCMDGNSSQTDINTCDQTDDDCLEAMFDYVNGKLGLTGKLIVFVAGHGRSPYGNHITITGETRCWGLYYSNVIKLNEYESKIDAITSDGTHILLWISACHGDGLNTFT